MAGIFELTDQAKRELEKIDPEIQRRVRKKLAHFFSAKNPMVFAKPLTDLPPATHRFRVWKLRAKFFRSGDIFYITSIEFRDKVYRRR